MSNILTIIRIIGTIPLIYLINKNGFNIYNFIFFVFLEITDFFDGYLARKFNNVTKFGTIADGIADKFSMITLTIILLIKDIIPIWTLIIFIRDIISCIFAIYYKIKYKEIIKANIFGKAKTTFHMITIGLTMLIGHWNTFTSILMICAIVLFVPEIIYVYKVIKNK